MFTLIACLLIGFSVWSSYKGFIEDKTLISRTYFKNLKDYIIALGIVILVFILVIFLFISMPVFIQDILKFSWIKIFNSSKSGTNLIMAPFETGNNYIIFIFWILLSLCLPYLAKSEEESFRSLSLSNNDRILSSIKFGFAHMVVGVPVFGAIVLSIVGYLFSIKYCKSYVKYLRKYRDSFKADSFAIEASTSLHAKYNFILITIVVLLLALN